VQLLDDLFRREAGRLVAALTRALGPGELTLAEDAVQEAMLTALQAWPARGVPADPAAWLFRAAKNRALDALRRRGADQRSTERLAALANPGGTVVDRAQSDRPIDDDVLAMMFMCCHPALPREARVVLTLKVMAGLGTGEVARGLLTTTDAIAQRLVRAKRTLRDLQVELVLPRADELPARVEAVLEVLYLVFTEGHVAHAGAELVRGDLCDEALRLGELLAATPGLDAPEVDALLALFHLVRARQPARVGPDGEPVLLDAQDRAAWDQGHLVRGFERLARSARGDTLSRWHLEAEIAACHAAAPSVEATDWPRIVDLYDELLLRSPTPVLALNRAVALARVRGPAAALAALEPLTLPGYHLLFATRAGLLVELGRRDEAASAYREALACPCSEPERRLLEARLSAI